jgi:hypothetical protein
MITFVIIAAIGLLAAHILARRHNAREVIRAAATLGGLGRPARLPILMAWAEWRLFAPWGLP